MEACNIHATCDMGQRFQRTLAHISVSLAGGDDRSQAGNEFLIGKCH